MADTINQLKHRLDKMEALQEPEADSEISNTCSH